jgi:hypothetical protein
MMVPSHITNFSITLWTSFRILQIKHGLQPFCNTIICMYQGCHCTVTNFLSLFRKLFKDKAGHAGALLTTTSSDPREADDEDNDVVVM